MSRAWLAVGCVVALSLLAGCSECCKGPAIDRDFDGAVSLFNGKDLTGWESTGNAKWAVEDGVLIGTQGENNAPGDLFTTQSYTNFVVSLIYRVEWPCNSGLWFRYQSPQKAYQADILEYKDPECYSGTLYCPGKMFLAMNTDKSIVNREGWNSIKVRAEGNTFRYGSTVTKPRTSTTTRRTPASWGSRSIRAPSSGR